jgi:hypothetical protein
MVKVSSLGPPESTVKGKGFEEGVALLLVNEVNK